MILAGDPPMQLTRIASFEASVAPIRGSEPARGSSRGGWPDDDARSRRPRPQRDGTRGCAPGVAVIQASGKSEFKFVKLSSLPTAYWPPPTSN